MKFILNWLIGSVSFLLVAYLIPGISISNFYIALIVTLIWGFLNTFIKPVLHLFALPVTILTLGLFSFVINGFIFWLISTFIKGFYVKNFWIAILGALLVSIFSFIFKKLLIKEE